MCIDKGPLHILFTQLVYKLIKFGERKMQGILIHHHTCWEYKTRFKEIRICKLSDESQSVTFCTFFSLFLPYLKRLKAAL